MNNFFTKDEDYSIPTSSNYMRFVEGDNVFRILGSFSEGTAIQGIEYWKSMNGTRKPIRVSREVAIPASEIETNPKTGEPDFPKYFWAFPVWNYQDKKVQILEITQKTILNFIKKQIQNPKWGNPLEYDFIVTREEVSGKTQYTVSCNPKEPIDPSILEEYKKMSIDITALYRGDDPFAQTKESTDLADDVLKGLSE